MQSLPKSYAALVAQFSLKAKLLAQLEQEMRQNPNRNWSRWEKEALVSRLRQADFLQKTTQIATWFPDEQTRKGYRKHVSFFDAGARYDERAVFGGNRTGKTHCGVYEDVLHLTGLYPDWWKGWRFTHPIDMWVATDTAKNTRDILQEKFCGKPGVPAELGTGMIPRCMFASSPTTKHGTPNAFESVFVHHVSGGTSTLMFKSYDQGREAFQGTQQDLIHLDEEPDIEIYSECSLRLMSTVPGQPNGKLILTETPLLGISELMTSFMPELRPEPAASPLMEWDHPDEDSEDGIVIDE